MYASTVGNATRVGQNAGDCGRIEHVPELSIWDGQSGITTVRQHSAGGQDSARAGDGGQGGKSRYFYVLVFECKGGTSCRMSRGRLGKGMLMWSSCGGWRK